MREKTKRTAFGKRLIAARERAKLTQPQVAKLVGVAQSTYGEMETSAQGSKHTPKLARVLNVRAEWLQSGAGAMTDLSVWPFTDELREAVGALGTESVQKLENVMRAHLGLTPVSNQSATETAAAQPESNTDSGTTGAAARKPGVTRRTVPLGESGETDRHGKVQAARGNRRGKGSA